MTNENPTISIIDYLEIALRRKWFIIIPFLLGIIITITLCFALPKIYKASTTILIIPQEVPDDFVRSTVTMNPSEYLNIIKQQIMSRTRLEKIINELSLFPLLSDKVSIDNLVAIMRKNIGSEVNSNRGRTVSSFSISYVGKDPLTVAPVANRLASLFIEENLNNRSAQARNTTEFLTGELEALKITLEEQEGKISTFKQRYLGSLPEQQDANLRMLDQLILQRQRITNELNDVENRKILLQQQLLQSDSVSMLPGNLQTGLPLSSRQAQINVIKQRLSELKNRYTPEHPDVISAEKELENLLAQSTPANQTAESSENAGTPFESEIDRQMLTLNLTIKTLKKEESVIKKKIYAYQSKVELAPSLEQQLASITRDYSNTKLAYHDLMTKRLAAKQSEKLEINQQGEQFRILDPAKVPRKPFKPNRPQIFLLGVILALGCGIGLAFLMEYFDNSFYTVKDLESYLELPALAAIPLITTDQGKTTSKAKTASL